MKFIKLILLPFVLSIISLNIQAQEKPSREQTIEYINKILKKTIGLEFFALESSYANQTIIENNLTYNADNRSHELYIRHKHYEADNQWCKIETRIQYKNFIFKNFSSISDNALHPAEYIQLTSPIKYIGIAFPAKEVTKESTAKYLYSNECRNNTNTPLYEANRPVDRIFIPYPTGDPDDLKRLKNAFLRLKELDADLKDPFLD